MHVSAPPRLRVRSFRFFRVFRGSFYLPPRHAARSSNLRVGGEADYIAWSGENRRLAAGFVYLSIYKLMYITGLHLFLRKCGRAPLFSSHAPALGLGHLS